MNDLFQQGIICFNEGRYFDAHEHWEDLWRESTGAPRIYYQGLVQVAVGLHHLTAGNLRGGTRVLRRGIEKLEARPERYSGIENHRLVSDLRKLLVADIRKAIESSECPRIQILTVGSDPAPASDPPDERV